MSTLEITANPDTPQLVMTREFDAPPELLLRAFIEPELLAQWLGPRSLTMQVDYLEARDAGRWRYVHRDADGNEYGFHGVFHGTPSLEGVVQTREFEGAPGHVSLETATFENLGGRTLLRMNAVYQSVEARDAEIASGMESGVRDSMDRLQELLETLTSHAGNSD